MRDIFSDLSSPPLSDPDPVRRAQIQMKQPLPKRFYTEVSIGESADGFTILLDGRTVKTPGKQLLALPTRDAAELIQREWQGQVEVINPLTMPVTRLANTAINGVADALDAVFDDIVNFAGTDLLCYRADKPDSLIEMQANHWDPIISWAADSIGSRFILVEGIIHRTQPQTAIDRFAATLEGHRTALRLAALHTITTLTGSALIALAFAEGHLTAEAAWQAAHVDEDWNVLKWGTDAEAEARRQARWLDMQAAARLFDAVKSDQPRVI